MFLTIQTILAIVLLTTALAKGTRQSLLPLSELPLNEQLGSIRGDQSFFGSDEIRHPIDRAARQS